MLRLLLGCNFHNLLGTALATLLSLVAVVEQQQLVELTIAAEVELAVYWLLRCHYRLAQHIPLLSVLVVLLGLMEVIRLFLL
jgi:hypothetical protein